MNIPRRDQLVQLIKKARYVFICGNGGSATTAEHFSNDLFKKGIRAVCLNSNTSIMTMIGNDYGYEQVFSEQIANYARGGDLVVTISCSGNSANIVNAQKTAFNRGISFFEFDTFGNRDKDYARLENEHLEFAHEVAKEL